MQRTIQNSQRKTPCDEVTAYTVYIFSLFGGVSSLLAGGAMFLMHGLHNIHDCIMAYDTCGAPHPDMESNFFMATGIGLAGVVTSQAYLSWKNPLSLQKSRAENIAQYIADRTYEETYEKTLKEEIIRAQERAKALAEAARSQRLEKEKAEIIRKFGR